MCEVLKKIDTKIEKNLTELTEVKQKSSYCFSQEAKIVIYVDLS